MSKYGSFGRFVSPQTAWSLYKIAWVLGKETGKRWYGELRAAIAYTMLLALDKTGAWPNGHWLAEMETHFRLQADGVFLLIAAYKEWGDEYFLEGAMKAADYIVQARDELSNGGWWFLHDSLESDEVLFLTKFQRYYAHRSFGKRQINTLTLNTHVQAVVMLGQLFQVTGITAYKEAFNRGMEALQWVLDSMRGRLVHRLAEQCLLLSFENHRASLIRRAVRHVVRRFLVHRLAIIQRFWPRFVTTKGYIWRDMALPIWGYWYHLVNLYDLLILYQTRPEPFIKDVIRKGMDFLKESNLIQYLFAQQHYILPQWLQILKAYAAITSNAECAYPVEQVKQQLVESGYGLPPEFYLPRGVFLIDDFELINKPVT